MSTDRIPPPQGDYVPATSFNGLVFSAGMTPRRDGRLTVTGLVGVEVDIPTARAAAGLAAANALAAVRSEMAPGESVRCLQMTVFIACRSDFTELSVVADGASQEVAAQLGGSNRLARSAIGVCALPSGAPVEVQLMAARQR